jgi:DNA-binding winged helix-turn-helix (wHTH) protein
MQGDFRLEHWLIQPQLNILIGPDNVSVQLEPRVMEVLVYLAERPGQVVSKETMLEAIWSDTFVTENALTRRIAELRRILRDDVSDPQCIQTIAKKGYRLIARLSRAELPASRYHIIGRLGRGAMSEVCLAEDPVLHRRVALKFVPEGMGKDEASRRRMLREARAAAGLVHPSICTIYESGEIDGRSFIAMEYVEGQTLRDRLTGGPLPINEACSWHWKLRMPCRRPMKTGSSIATLNRRTSC